MTTVIQNKFDGGMAEDIRTTETDQCEFSKNFDIFTNPHKLIPYGDSIAETTSTGTMDDFRIADIDVSLVGAGYLLTGVGFESSISSKSNYFQKSDIISSLIGGLAISANGAHIQGTLVVYKNKAYNIVNNSGTIILYRYDSPATVTSIGTFSATGSIPRPFVHPLDNILYIVCGQTIASYDGTTFTSVATILPSGFNIPSMTNYGQYLAFLASPTRGTGSASILLWGRDMTLNTLQGNIDLGEGDFKIIENLNENLIVVGTPQNTLNTTISNKILVRGYSGGSVETLRSITLSGTSQTLGFSKIKNNNKVYFSFNNDDAVYVVGKNKSGTYIITKDRYIFNSATIGSSSAFLSMIGDILWTGFTSIAGAFTLMRSKVVAFLGETISYANTSVYRTTINTGMPVEDRYKNKQLNWVRITYTNGGTAVLKYSVDGSSFTTSITRTGGSGQIVAEEEAESTGAPFLTGREFQFQVESTTNCQIKEIAYNYTILTTV